MTYEELQKRCQAAGIILSNEQIAQLKDYASLLIEWNNRMNLTSIVEESQIVEKHFYDCLIPAKVFDFAGKNLIDLGTGAGFPGLVLAIAFPSLTVTLADATKKKFEFLEEVVRKLNLTNVKMIDGRVELLSNQREHFDVATARAFSSLPCLIEVGVPLLKVRGTLIAMKSSKAEEELKTIAPALQKLESTIVQKQLDELPSDHDKRINIFIRKKQKTSIKYPRPWAKIVSNPL